MVVFTELQYTRDNGRAALKTNGGGHSKMGQRNDELLPRAEYLLLVDIDITTNAGPSP